MERLSHPTLNTWYISLSREIHILIAKEFVLEVVIEPTLYRIPNISDHIQLSFWHNIPIIVLDWAYYYQLSYDKNSYLVVMAWKQENIWQYGGLLMNKIPTPYSFSAKHLQQDIAEIHRPFSIASTYLEKEIIPIYVPEKLFMLSQYC